MGRDLIFVFIFTVVFLSRLLNGQSVFLPGILLFAYCSALIFREYRIWHNRRFVDQLKTYRPELRSGSTVGVDHILLRYDSILTSYTLSFGFLFTSVNIPSLYFLSPPESPPKALFYSVVTLLTGWWSITGPVEALSAIAHNISGGEKLSVKKLIDG